MVDTGITFASGAAYGLTTVAVGQPFDTVKTVVQSRGGGSVEAARRVVAESGLLRGLYRGSVPLVVGGTFMRSAQFGCNDLGRDAIRASGAPRVKLFGVIDSHVVFGRAVTKRHGAFKMKFLSAQCGAGVVPEHAVETWGKIRVRT